MVYSVWASVFHDCREMHVTKYTQHAAFFKSAYSYLHIHIFICNVILVEAGGKTVQGFECRQIASRIKALQPLNVTRYFAFAIEV